ncbi:hypothetical protein DY218_28605 [Streptomyces triticagri]|uniref:Uncharacterized protein n=1 Tax=Streptomyces triticagri TaxID=2293568 RepID=A0A372LXA6_9ACTN|nr:hypothetical protein [Streptomyces triticagri]RFU83271.1 hypothetical protein DY218_28605 [Streptomyces triticagri]
MAITLSVVFVLGIAAFVLLRFKAVGLVAAVILVLFGFYLADTDASSTIRQITNSVIDTIRDIDT